MSIRCCRHLNGCPSELSRVLKKVTWYADMIHLPTPTHSQYGECHGWICESKRPDASSDAPTIKSPGPPGRRSQGRRGHIVLHNLHLAAGLARRQARPGCSQLGLATCTGEGPRV